MKSVGPVTSGKGDAARSFPRDLRGGGGRYGGSGKESAAREGEREREGESKRETWSTSVWGA